MIQSLARFVRFHKSIVRFYGGWQIACDSAVATHRYTVIRSARFLKMAL